MSECIPCKTLKDCLQFKDFDASNTNAKLYLSTTKTLTIACPSGESQTVNLDAGIIGYVLNFQPGNPPYPDLVLNCTGGQITVPVPDGINQAQLDALIVQLLNTCLEQIAKDIGCSSGNFYNTLQSIKCSGGFTIAGAVPTGISIVTIGSSNDTLQISGGIVQSSISTADANQKALQLLNDAVKTGNVICAH